MDHTSGLEIETITLEQKKPIPIQWIAIRLSKDQPTTNEICVSLLLQLL